MPAILNDTYFRDSIRYFVATVDGVRYEIPEAWSMGYCRTHGGSAIDAALAWHEQAQLEVQARRERATELRQELHALVNSGKRGARVRERVADLEWEIDHLTHADAINARRADMNLTQWVWPTPHND